MMYGEKRRGAARSSEERQGAVKSSKEQRPSVLNESSCLTCYFSSASQNWPAVSAFIFSIQSFLLYSIFKV